MCRPIPHHLSLKTYRLSLDFDSDWEIAEFLVEQMRDRVSRCSMSSFDSAMSAVQLGKREDRDLVQVWSEQIFGVHWMKQAERELYRSALLLSTSPHLASVTCSQCREWWYDPLTGETLKSKGRTGEPLLRPEPKQVMCETSLGCRKGHWKDPIEVSQRSRDAIEHYKDCLAFGKFPDDPVVMHNAKLIKKGFADGQRKINIQRMCDEPQVRIIT